jgi:hypothetical protein
MKRFGILLMAALVAGAPGYGNAQATGEKSVAPATQPQSQVEGKEAQPEKVFTKQERRDYEKQAAAELATMQQKIEGIEATRNTARQQLRPMIFKGLVGLKKQFYTNKNYLAAMEKAADKNWGGMKVNMDKAMANWNKAYENFVANVKQ